MGKAHGIVVVAIVFFAFVPFFFPSVPWLAMVPAILGIFEAFIHVAGIWIHRLKRPYTWHADGAVMLAPRVSVDHRHRGRAGRLVVVRLRGLLPCGIRLHGAWCHEIVRHESFASCEKPKARLVVSSGLAVSFRGVT